MLAILEQWNIYFRWFGGFFTTEHTIVKSIAVLDGKQADGRLGAQISVIDNTLIISPTLGQKKTGLKREVVLIKQDDQFVDIWS